MKILYSLFTFIIMISNSFNSPAQNNSSKILVAYYSYSGNTKIVAEQIQKGTDGDIFEIQPVESYPKDYQEVVDQAKKEINNNYKPELKTKVKDIEKYDVIFVGSPCWWATIAPPVATFLSSHNLSGKTIIPFMTHEGSRMGHTENDIKTLCPKSKVLNGLPIRGSQVKQAEGDVMKWLEKIGMLKK
ncbi:flavodoxin [Coprobacter fastidiosus]|uniref:flavodoxin n=1 Tax=Coprobacter TaxID=1348911 RepID=UPI002619409F|nr:flavodoxin [Coprobacter fastidiosus]MBS6268721.1 NAD(P)H-dependent oxidoreductase [Tannerella sp.]